MRSEEACLRLSSNSSSCDPFGLTFSMNLKVAYFGFLIEGTITLIVSPFYQAHIVFTGDS